MTKLSIPIIILVLSGCNLTTQQNWVSTNGADIQSSELTQKHCESKADTAYLNALSGTGEKEADINVNVQNSIIIAKKNEPNAFMQGYYAAQENHQRELKIQQQKKVQKALESIRSYAMASCMEKAGYRLQDKP